MLIQQDTSAKSRFSIPW